MLQPAIVFEHLINEITDLALLVRGRELRIQASSRSIRDHLGLTERELRERRLDELPPSEEERERVRQAVGGLFGPQREVPRTSLRVRLGSRVHVPVSATLTRIDDVSEAFPLLMLVAPNVSERGTGEGPLDGLTGLPLRQALDRRLADLRTCAGGGEHHALFFLDVDRFKSINDGHGHLAGDAVLRTIARRLVHSLRPGDLVVRFGGDEFVALVPALSGRAEADQIARRIRDALREPVSLASGRLAVSVSVGVSLSSTAELNGVQLLQAADRAMYRAKSLGPDGPYVMLAAG